MLLSIVLLSLVQGIYCNTLLKQSREEATEKPAVNAPNITKLCYVCMPGSVTITHNSTLKGATPRLGALNFLSITPLVGVVGV